MEFIGSILKEDSKKFYLNTEESKILQVCLDSVHPECKLVIRLTDHKKNQNVDFTLNSWKNMLGEKQKIRSNFYIHGEEIIFISDQLKVFTQRRQGDITVCFMDFSSQVVNINSRAFEKISECSGEVISTYLEYEKKIRSRANSLKAFVESIILKNCIDNKQENNVFLIKALDKLQNMPSAESVKSVPASRNVNSEGTDDDEDDDDDEFENDSEASDESENNCCDCGCYHCGSNDY